MPATRTRHNKNLPVMNPFLHAAWRTGAVAALALCAVLVALPCAAVTDAALLQRGQEIEANLMAHPKRSLAGIGSAGAAGPFRRCPDAPLH